MTLLAAVRLPVVASDSTEFQVNILTRPPESLNMTETQTQRASDRCIPVPEFFLVT